MLEKNESFVYPCAGVGGRVFRGVEDSGKREAAYFAGCSAGTSLTRKTTFFLYINDLQRGGSYIV